MLVANVTLITFVRIRPLAQRISGLRHTSHPMMSEMSKITERACLVEDYDSVKLADAIELALQHDWQKKFDMPRFIHVIMS